MTRREVMAWLDEIEWQAFIYEGPKRWDFHIQMIKRLNYNRATARTVTGWL